MYFRYNENSAMPWEDDGTYAFNDVNGRSCSGDGGIGIRKTYLANQNYFVRLRAMKDDQLIESNEVVVNVANPNVTLKSRIHWGTQATIEGWQRATKYCKRLHEKDGL